MSKKTVPSDHEVEALLAQMNIPVEKQSPATLSFAPEETEAKAEATPVDEDKPIQIILPERHDPTKLDVLPDVPLIQPVDSSGKLADDPAARLGEIQSHDVTSTAQLPADMGVTAHMPVDPLTIHATTPISVQIPEPPPQANPLEALSPEIQQVIKEARVTAWPVLDDPEKPYWSARQGPRSVGVPWNADVAEWRQRLSSISV